MSVLAYMGYYYYDVTYLLVILGAVLSMIASAQVNSTFKRYSRVRSGTGRQGICTVKIPFGPRSGCKFRLEIRFADFRPGAVLGLQRAADADWYLGLFGSGAVPDRDASG